MKHLKLFEGYGKNCLMSTNGSCHIFYHQSDVANITEFKKIKSGGKYNNYMFFSSEVQHFVSRKYTYQVLLYIKSVDIFNNFIDSEKNFNIKSSYVAHKSEIDELLKTNMEYFYKLWVESGVDSPEDVEYYIEESSNEKPVKLNKLELLIEFFSKWNDSWIMVESEIFLNFIESKGYKAFITKEEGITNIGINLNNTIEIINKSEN